MSPYAPSASQSPSSLYLRTPAVALSSAELSGGGAGKRIFLPQRGAAGGGEGVE